MATRASKSPHIPSDSEFLAVYSNLPLAERSKVVLILGGEPISWELARNEIIHSSPRKLLILRKLGELGII